MSREVFIVLVSFILLITAIYIASVYLPVINFQTFGTTTGKAVHSLVYACLILVLAFFIVLISYAILRMFGIIPSSS